MKAVIVGGNGKMGKLFQDLLSRLGYHVESLEEGDWDRAEILLGSADIVLLAVPIYRIEEVIRQVAGYLNKNTVLSDIVSVKQQPLSTMLYYHSGPVVALHPMFGPNLEFASPYKVKRPYRIVNCGGRALEKSEKFIQSLASFGFEMINMTAEEHDSLTAYIQGLQYFAVFTEGYFAYQNNFAHDILRMSASKDSTIKNAHSELLTMFSDSSKYALYEGLLFICEDRISLYCDFLETADYLLQGNVTSMKKRFLADIAGLWSYFPDLVTFDDVSIIDLASPLTRLHYFLVLCEALVLLKNSVNKEALLKISTSNYLGKLRAIGNLLSVKNPEEIFESIFNCEVISDYHELTKAMGWIYTLKPKETFASLYPQVSLFVRSVECSSMVVNDLENTLKFAKL